MRLLLLFVLLMMGSNAASAGELLDDVPRAHRQAVQSWLSRHPEYRVAVTEDCQCDDDIALVRNGSGGPWEPVPSYQPYLAAGDFTGDGADDLAVVVLPTQTKAPILVLVSRTAPRGSVKEMLEIPQDGPNLVSRGLFVRPPSPGNCHWRLLFGAFESEADDVPIEH